MLESVSDDGHAGAVEPPDRGRGPWKQGDLGGVGQVVAIFDQGAVPVQEHPGASRQHGAGH